MSLELIAKWFREKDDFFLTTHIQPDGDGLGAQSALLLALRRMGKHVRVVNHDPLPRCYQWLPFKDDVEVSDVVPPHQVCVVLDAADLSRIREGVRRDEFKLIINIDHHPSNSLFGDLNWVDPEAPAVGEMVYRLLHALEIPIDKDIAESLYTSLVTDTGAFRYSNTNPRAHRLAAELMEAGADSSKVCHKVFSEVSQPAMELLRLALARLSTREGGKIGLLTLTQDEFKKSGAYEEDAENLVDFVRKITGVEVAVFLKERPDGRWRLSLRSRNRLDMSALASLFGGGGHKYAAGAVLDGPMEEAVERVMAAVSESLKKHK